MPQDAKMVMPLATSGDHTKNAVPSNASSCSSNIAESILDMKFLDMYTRKIMSLIRAEVEIIISLGQTTRRGVAAVKCFPQGQIMS